MDIEQLKLILEAANAAGEGAMTLAYLWIGKSIALSLVGYSIWGGLVLGVYKVISRLITVVFNADKIANVAREVLNAGHWDLTNSVCVERLCRWIDEKNKA